MFHVPIATMEHMEPISGLQHHDVILILRGYDSALKDIEDAIQSTSGPLEPSQKRGTSVNKDPRVGMLTSPSIPWRRIRKVRVSTR